MITKLGKNLSDTLWNSVIDKYKQDGLDLSYIQPVYSTKPRYNNGEICTTMPVNQYGGCWTNTGKVYINPKARNTIDYYAGKKVSDDEYKKSLRVILAHELAHEAYNNVLDEEKRTAIINEAKNKKFTTDYLKHVKPSKLDEETFCEYMAHKNSGLI